MFPLTPWTEWSVSSDVGGLVAILHHEFNKSPLMEEKVFKLVLGCVRISLSHKLLSFHIWLFSRLP